MKVLWIVNTLLPELAQKLLIDIISEVLSGAVYLNKIGQFYLNTNNGMNVGFCCIAINPEIIFLEKYRQKIYEFVQNIRTLEKAGQNVIQLPDDKRHESNNRNLHRIVDKNE